MIKLKAFNENLKFIIEEDLPEVGVYIYIYDKSENCIADYLQNDLNTAKEFVKERYEVQPNQWLIE